MQRKYDIDWLRTIIVLSIIPFHAFIVFNQNPNAIMYVKDKVNVLAFNYIGGAIDRFHMVALFLISGMAINYTLRNKSLKVYLFDKFRKLFLPFLTGSILLNPIMTYFWCMNQGRQESFIKHYIGFFTKNVEGFDGLKGGYTPAHLWFVLYLLIYSIIGLPLYMWLNQKKSEKLRNALAAFFYKPMTLILLAIPYCFIYLIEILDEKNPIAYLYILMLGCIIATDERYIKALNRDKWIYISISVLMYIIFYHCKNIDFTNMWHQYLFDFLVKLLKIVPAYALIGLFNCYITKNSRILSYLSKACYPIYIIHMVIVTSISFVVIKFNINPISKFLIIVILSYIICFIMYESIKQTRYLGMLFGIIKNKK